MNSKEYIDYLESYIKYTELCINNIKRVMYSNINNFQEIFNNFENNKIIHYVLKYFYEKRYNDDILISYLATQISGVYFIEFLQNIYDETEEGNEFEGYMISNNYYEDDEEYFGKNKIKFYSYVGELKEDILTYKEFYEYLQIASDFYIELHPEQKEEVIALLEKIKAKYLA